VDRIEMAATGSSAVGAVDTPAKGPSSGRLQRHCRVLSTAHSSSATPHAAAAAPCTCKQEWRIVTRQHGQGQEDMPFCDWLVGSPHAVIIEQVCSYRCLCRQQHGWISFNTATAV
jgi:hypothetical protein